MRSLTSLKLTTLAVVGLSVVPLAFQSGAMAATAQAKPAKAGHAGPAKRHRLARASCRPTSMYFGGRRVCVYSTPYTYSIDPVDGSARLLWPR